MSKLPDSSITISIDILSHALESAFNHIIITDKDGIIVYANPAVEKITGYKREELIGKKSNVWGKQMSKEFYEHMWNTICVQRRTFEGELINRKKSGELYYAKTIISPIFSNESDLIGFIGTEEDITKIKEVDKMKSEFISLASHQLKTPLSSIKWNSEMLLDGDAGQLNTVQSRMTKNINESSERMIEMVNMLLNITRIEAGKLIVEAKDVAVNDLLDDVFMELSGKILSKSLEVIKQLSLKNTVIHVDVKLVHQILTNILSNSIKYTEPGGKITLEIYEMDDMLCFSVQDTGIGIPLSDSKYIFDKFYRGSNASTMDPDGSGLGLYFVKALVTACGGKIWFESTENVGSKFYFILPISLTDHKSFLP